MSFLRLVSLATLLVCALASNDRGPESKQYPGLNIYLRSTFFSDLEKDVIPAMKAYLAAFKIEGFKKNFTTSFFDANITVTECWFTDVSINEQNTGVTFPKTNNQIKFTIDNISARFNIKYDIVTRPAFLVDKGQGYAAMTNFNFSITLSPYSDSNGHLSIKAEDVVLTLNHDAFQFEFSGSSSVSRFLGYIAADLNNLLSQQWLEQLSPQLSGIIVGAINSNLATIPYQAQIPNTGIYVDYKLLDVPTVSIMGLGLEHNATFFKRGSYIPFAGPVKMPVNEDKGRNMEIFLSEYTINTQLFAIYELKLLETKITKETVKDNSFIRMDTDFIGISIPEFRQIYKPKRQVQLDIKAPSRPELIIVQDDMDLNITLALDIQVKNDNNDGFDSAVIVYFNITCDVDFAFVGQSLKIQLNKMDYDIFDKKSNVGDVSGKELDTLFNIGFPILKGLINGKIQDGFPLPLPKGLELVNFVVKERPGYLYIESDTTFKPQVQS